MPTSRTALLHQLVLVQLRMGDPADLVREAEQLLLQGDDNPGVLEIACAHPDEWRHDPAGWRARLDRAMVGLGLVPLTGDQLVLRATQARVDEFLAGRTTDRDLTSWAHRHVTHAGPDALQDLVCLDDELDSVDDGFGMIRPGEGWVTADTEEMRRVVHERLTVAARAVAALPDPWAAGNT